MMLFIMTQKELYFSFVNVERSLLYLSAVPVRGEKQQIKIEDKDTDKTVELLNSLGEKAWAMGHIVDNAESVAGADEKIRVIFA